MDYIIAGLAASAAVAAVYVQSPGLRLSTTMQAILALLALAIIEQLGRRYRAKARGQRVARLIVSWAGIWAATQAGLLVSHALFGSR